MKPGAIYFFKDFLFEDGGKADKLVVILNNPKGNEPYLLCPTTSKQHRRKAIIGCHSQDNYFFIDQRQDNLHMDTWIVFHKIYSHTAAQIKHRFDEGDKEILVLEETLWRAIKNCILKSKDIEQDYLEMIKRG